MATNKLGGIPLPSPIPVKPIYGNTSSPLGILHSLFKGMSDAFVGFLSDMYSSEQSERVVKERRLYLALLVILGLLFSHLFLD
jgi:hypothetical protein